MQNTDRDLKLRQHSRDLARQGNIAAKKIEEYSEEKIDEILKKIVEVIKKNEVFLATLEVKETGIGKIEDRIIINNAASETLYNAIRGTKTVGIINNNIKERIVTIGKPRGLIVGVLPLINWISVIISMIINSIKSKNAIIFIPHPLVENSTAMVIRILLAAAIEAGAPENIISSLETYSEKGYLELIEQPEISLVIGNNIFSKLGNNLKLKSKFFSLKNDNTLIYIEKTAKVKIALKNLIKNKEFNNGAMGTLESGIICEESNEKEIIIELESQGAYVMTDDESEQLRKVILGKDNKIGLKYLGKSVEIIAEEAKIKIPMGTKVLLENQNKNNGKATLSYRNGVIFELFVVKGCEEACILSNKLLEKEIARGISVYTENILVIEKISEKLGVNIFLNIERIPLEKDIKRILVEDISEFDFFKVIKVKYEVSDSDWIMKNRTKIKIPDILKGKKYNCYKGKGVTSILKESSNNLDIESLKQKEFLNLIDEMVKVLKR